MTTSGAALGDDGLKKPIVVYILGLCFLIAPFFNFIGNLYNQKIPNWSSPETWWVYSQNIATFSLVWLTLLFLAGGALLMRRKLSWFFAVFVLVFTVVYNLIINTFFSIQTRIDDSIYYMCTVAAIVVLYFFRYPYLDRRGYLFIAKRYPTCIEVKIPGIDSKVNIMNLSKSGVYLEWDDLNECPPVGDVIEIQITDHFSIFGKIVRKTENGCGLQIVKIDGPGRTELKGLIDKLKNE